MKFLFPLITRWGSEKFGMFNHISREYTFLSSERLGKALGRLVTDPNSIPPLQTQFKDSGPYQPITATPTGPPDPSLVKPALAFYLYTSTADDSYRQLISKRVLDLLAAERSYQYMMADATDRARSLAKKNIKIDFDLSQLRATPVAITGLPHCNSQPGVQWVQIDGAMIFTYASPVSSSKEPVQWPSTSHIYIPTIVEDGVRKFDGYCPEPSMADQGTPQPRPTIVNKKIILITNDFYFLKLSVCISSHCCGALLRLSHILCSKHHYSRSELLLLRRDNSVVSDPTGHYIIARFCGRHFIVTYR